MMRASCILVLAADLAGCATHQVEQPPAPSVPPAVVCAAPGEMTTVEGQPERPAGKYTQRDVALYIESLHRWGAHGWERVAAVRAWSKDCVDRAAVRAGGKAR